MNTTPTERIFISYKRKDTERVFAIKNKIENATGEKCWIDLDGIESDAQFADVIINAINEAEIFLFMYSKSHTKIIDHKKDWTIREISFASKKDKRIVFVNIDNTPLTDWFELMFGTTQQIDATDPDKLENLNKDLCKWLGITPNTIHKESKETKKLQDKVLTTMKNMDGKKVAKGAAIAAGVAAGVIIAPIGTAIVGGAVGAKKLLDKYKQKNKKA